MNTGASVDELGRDEVRRDTYLIDSDTSGIQLQLRRRRRSDMCEPSSCNTLLLMHGATFPSESLFDVPVDGASFMDVLAMAGFDVWAVDARGYGGSTRPVEMSAPDDANPPLTPARVAARDLASAVEYILDENAIERLNLVAMSWGGSVAGIYASQHGEYIEKLVLVAPLWLSSRPLRIDAGQPLTAWRSVNVDAFREAWLTGVPIEQHEALLPPGWFEQWAAVTNATDLDAPESGTIRAPGGAIQDTREHWLAGRPLYDPGAITAPVLLVHAEWDQDVRLDMMQDLFSRLDNASYRRWIEIGSGTHMILMEPGRWQAFDAIIAFLREPTRGA
ncbi:alpha/beta hydrolase [Halomonas binhaiensis]|uniref:Alpha/beta hydrolase n=1 Tax=Halomonas binhaiensis TaxID=2562282 RepID=A0A5C1NKU6_9GAMM|nr:alpha/beta hydrolase [Halomonas binhaiensis]QEM83017.1 alpha/beta hydrolase [Halomonas binhaiensis]